MPFLNNIDSDAKSLRKEEEDNLLKAGEHLSSMSKQKYQHRIEGLCNAAHDEYRIHKAQVAVLPPFIVTALREGDARTLHAYRTRRGAESLHIAIETWWHLGGGKQACAAQGIS